MIAVDFLYDNRLLSSFENMMICCFNNSSLETVDIGQKLNFNTKKVYGKDKLNALGAYYEEGLSLTFQIGKIPCNDKPVSLSVDEQSEITRWLNRKDGFHKFKIVQDGYENLYAEASFNLKKIEIYGEVYGFELTMTTLHPYLLQEPIQYTYEFHNENNTFQIYDQSDELGYIYADITIECLSSGTLTIHNKFEDRTMEIKNCKSGEIIKIDGENQIISTSDSSHQIQNDFNFSFFRIANTYYDKTNIITVSKPCKLTITYSPVKKVGV